MKRDISIEDNEIRIKIDCVLRRYAVDQRIIVQYERDVLSMIPEEYQGRISIKESPSGPISNLAGKSNHSASGLWVFEIEKLTEAPQKTTNRRNPSTKARKPAIIKKVENKATS